jgi:hypothetical protein
MLSLIESMSCFYRCRKVSIVSQQNSKFSLYIINDVGMFCCFDDEVGLVYKDKFIITFTRPSKPSSNYVKRKSELVDCEKAFICSKVSTS